MRETKRRPGRREGGPRGIRQDKTRQYKGKVKSLRAAFLPHSDFEDRRSWGRKEASRPTGTRILVNRHGKSHSDDGAQ